MAARWEISLAKIGSDPANAAAPSRAIFPSRVFPALRLISSIGWDEPCLTLTCSPAQKQTERCHPDETRPFTVREYARIQTFPDDWKFEGSMAQQYKQIGNAVPVNLGTEVGYSIVNFLNQYYNLSKPK